MSKQTSTYLVLQANRGSGPLNTETGLRPVNKVRVVRALANRPATLERDQIAVKVTVEVPEGAFDPVSPAALVIVPEDLTLRGPIEVVATDAREEE